MPFLSLQVRLDLGTNIFRGLEPENKAQMVKENIIQDMLSDITDIALLQEVIDRTQEKINFLCPPPVLSVLSGDYYNIENDSFELPSDSSTKARETTGLSEVFSHIEKLMKEGSRKQEEKTETDKLMKAEKLKVEAPAT